MATLPRAAATEFKTVPVAATRIQAKYKGYRMKGDYQKQREAGEWVEPQIHDGFCSLSSSTIATKIENCWRGLMARKEREKRAWAVKVIKRWVTPVS